MKPDDSTLDLLKRTQLKQTLVVQKLITLYYFELSKNYIFKGERHNFWEMVYVDRGEIEVTANGRVYLLKQGFLIFHKPNEFHQFHATEGLAPNIIVITFDCHSEAMRRFEEQVFQIGELERNLLAQIISEGRHTFKFPFEHPLKRLPKALIGSEQLLRNYLEILLILLLRQLEFGESTVAPLSLFARNNNETTQFKVICEYVERHLGDQLGVAETCSRFYITRARLQALFQQHTNGSYMEYVTANRMSQAKKLIREGSCNVTEIANQTGYSSIHYFSKAFKKETGMSPTEYALSIKARM